MGIKPDTLYIVTVHGGVDESYAWTPDGEGMYWYDSEDEAREDHLYPLDAVVYVTEDELEEMRYGDE